MKEVVKTKWLHRGLAHRAFLTFEATYDPTYWEFIPLPRMSLDYIVGKCLALGFDWWGGPFGVRLSVRHYWVADTV